jgi:predicted ester cyclase
MKQGLTRAQAAFSDISITVEDQIAEGDKVVSRWTIRGTHKGEYMGIAPTGKQVTITGISIYRIEKGKIVEDWANSDMLGMLQQLGAIPSLS